MLREIRIESGHAWCVAFVDGLHRGLACLRASSDLPFSGQIPVRINRRLLFEEAVHDQGRFPERVEHGCLRPLRESKISIERIEHESEFVRHVTASWLRIR